MGAFSFLLNSTIGKKVIMGVTGICLVGFLAVHCFVNSLIFVNDGGELFNTAAEFMAHNVLIRTMEIFLFLGLILHALQGINLVFKNMSARKVKYYKQDGAANSKWYSRSMGLLGTLLLLFLILHLKHFWYVSRLTEEISSGDDTLFGEMKEVFANPIVVAIYIIGVISLAYHLLHGFQSAFQSLGFNHKKYTPFIKSFGFWYSIIISILFAVMPLALHLGWVK
ncbi:MAG: succinate dehydrogenase cytochrome b subunit [Bacteroidia bacterium]|nr:succinate dehydrogenase cytochrome b subunit [Bacteroidia bacterium]